MVFGNNYTILS